MDTRDRIRKANAYALFTEMPDYELTPSMVKEAPARFRQKFTEIFLSEGLQGLNLRMDELIEMHDTVLDILNAPGEFSQEERDKAERNAYWIELEVWELGKAITQISLSGTLPPYQKPHQEVIYNRFVKLKSNHGVKEAFDILKDHLKKLGLDPVEYNLKDDPTSFDRACRKNLHGK